MKRIFTGIIFGIASLIIIMIVWQTIVVRKELRENIEIVNSMISKFEAKVQFIDSYLPVVSEYTGSQITAKRILAAVYENSLQYDLSPELILSVMKVESEFNPRAYSNAGAIGLMQVMPVTGMYVGRNLGLWLNNEDDLFNIEKNIQIGVVFLKECIERLGEERGLGYYYAGRNTQYYRRYTKKIAAAQHLWTIGDGA